MSINPITPINALQDHSTTHATNYYKHLTLQNIIIVILILALAYYFYSNNYSNIKTQVTEAFSQYSSIKGDKSLSNTVQFDTNQYLRKDNKIIKINNKQSLPVIKYALIECQICL